MPSLGPDLNPIENEWSDMSKIIYDKRKQYRNTCKLKTAILSACLKIPLKNRKLCSWNTKQDVGCFKRKGAKINKWVSCHKHDK